MSTGIFEGFSLTRAAILNGTTGAEQAVSGQFYGCRTGSITVTEGNYDNTGDDTVLSKWYWFDYAAVTVDLGYISFATISLISGAQYYSSGTSPNDYWTVPLWTTSSVNQPTRPMLVRALSKDSAGAIRTLDFVLYKVQFAPFNFTGPAYKAGIMMSYAGTALKSPVDEVGNPLGEAAIGRLVSSPGNLQGVATAPFGTAYDLYN